MSVGQSVLKKVIDAVVISSTYTSEVFEADWLSTLSFEIEWGSGSGIVGTFAIEASVSGNNWIALDTSQFQPDIAMDISGASGFHIRDITSGTGLRLFRIKFTIANAGSMIANAWIGAKHG